MSSMFEQKESLNHETQEHKQFLQIIDKWKEICNTQNTRNIIRCWNQYSNVLSSNGSWYLRFCILNNDISSLTILLDHQHSLSCIDNAFGYGMNHSYTPILFASRYANFRSIQLLCSKGADICLSSNANMLEYIFENTIIKDSNVIPCVEFLVTLGCSVRSNAIWCLSYYNAHKKFDRVYLASFLKQHGADLIHITTAIKYGHLKLAHWLIQNKCKIYNTYLTDVKTEEGINLLIENGIQNINHNDSVYGTALFYHSQRGNIDAVKALLNHNANQTILCTKNKLTALQIAKRNKHEQIMHLLTNKEKLNHISECKTSASKYNIEFRKLPNNPFQIKDAIQCEEKYFDESNATAVLIENKIEALQIKLKKEYKKIVELRMEQSERRNKINGWEVSLQLWNEFISHWNQWDISCFVEWLKRINCWKTGSFETYFKSDQDAVYKIEQIMLSDPLTFGIGNNKDNDATYNTMGHVTFGEQLTVFDRYTLYKIGIYNTGDCNVIANEIHKLCRRRNKDSNDVSSMEDDLCAICWDRQKTHVLNCGHRFCEPDIKIVQRKNKCCPICKAKITIVIKLY